MEQKEIIEIVFKFAAAIASVIAAYKVLTEIVINKKSKLRDEYDFLKKYLCDIFETDYKNLKEVHPFIIEKGYQAISGKLIKSNEIQHLLNFRFPSDALKNFTRGRDYLELGENEKFNFKESFTDKKIKRLTRVYKYSYFFYAFIGLSPLFLGTIFGFTITLKSVLAFIVFTVSFVSIAIMNLYAYWQIESAKHLISEQEKNA